MSALYTQRVPGKNRQEGILPPVSRHQKPPFIINPLYLSLYISISHNAEQKRPVINRPLAVWKITTGQCHIRDWRGRLAKMLDDDFSSELVEYSPRCPAPVRDVEGSLIDVEWLSHYRLVESAQIPENFSADWCQQVACVLVCMNVGSYVAPSFLVKIDSWTKEKNIPRCFVITNMFNGSDEQQQGLHSTFETFCKGDARKMTNYVTFAGEPRSAICHVNSKECIRLNQRYPIRGVDSLFSLLRWMLQDSPL